MDAMTRTDHGECVDDLSFSLESLLYNWCCSTDYQAMIKRRNNDFRTGLVTTCVAIRPPSVIREKKTQYTAGNTIMGTACT